MSLIDKPRGSGELRWVSTGWLESHLGDDMTILDTQPDCHDYFLAHVPGAVHLEDNALNFPLLSDYTRETIRTYGIELHDFAGLKGYTVAKRSVFLLDGGGVVRWRWVSDDPGVEPDYAEIRRQLGRF
ncbi:MAG: redoxin domain-containing protein, partial [Candidatus Bathyarchaeota archaeon]|nr:redoxin domain-containing protein [Candidatus Bathyarchaeota archaeon]